MSESVSEISRVAIAGAICQRASSVERTFQELTGIDPAICQRQGALTLENSLNKITDIFFAIFENDCTEAVDRVITHLADVPKSAPGRLNDVALTICRAINDFTLELAAVWQDQRANADVPRRWWGGRGALWPLGTTSRGLRKRDRHETENRHGRYRH